MEDAPPEGDDFSLEDAASLLTGDSSGMLTGEFGKQLGGSAVANIFTLLMIGLFVGLKRLCSRPSKCKSHLHCPCIDVDIMDRSGDTLREVPKIKAERGETLV